MAGIRILFKLLQAPTVPRAPYSGQYCGLTTSDQVDQDGGTVLYPGYIIGARASNSMDISGGQGSLAEAIEAEISVADDTADGTSLSKAIHDGDLSFAGATVWVSYAHAGSTEVSRLVQARIVGDPEYSPGVVTFKLKSATYTVGKTFLNRFSFPEIPTKPADASAPSDPAYPLDPANHITTPAYSGECYGGLSVSLKAGKGPAVQVLSRWRDSALKTGDISTTSYDDNPAGYGEVSYELSEAASTIQAAEYADYDILRYSAGIFFKCRTKVIEVAPFYGESDTTEAEQFAQTIQEYIDNGYRIVLSDGNWFVDILAYSHSSKDALCGISPQRVPNNQLLSAWSLGVNGFTLFRTTSEMAGTEYPMAGVAFALCDANGTELFRDLPNAESVKVYAVPASINVATGDKILLGVARNQKTAAAAFDQKSVGGSTFAIPSCADSAGFVVAESIPAKVSVYANDLPWSGYRPSAYPNRRGFVLWEGDWITSGASSGDLADVNTDPSSVESSDILTATSVRAIDDFAQNHGQIDLRVQSDQFGDLNMIGSSVRVAADGIYYGYDSGVKYLYNFLGTWYHAPYSKRRKWITAHSLSSAYESIKDRRHSRDFPADHAPKAPDWNCSFTDEEAARHPLQVGLTHGIQGMAPSLEFAVREMFAWRFNRLSFSEIYGTVWPFWTQQYYTGAWSNAWGDFTTGSYTLAVSNSDEYAVCHLTDAGEEWTKFTLPGSGIRRSIIGGGYDLATLTFFVIWRDQLDDTGTSWRVGFEKLDATGAWVSTTTHDMTSTTPSSAWIGNGEVHFALGSDVLRWSVSGAAVISTEVFSSPISRGQFNGSIWLFGAESGVFAASADFATVTPSALAERMAGVSYGYFAWCAVGADGAIYEATVATAATHPTTWVKRFSSSSVPNRYPTKEPVFSGVSWDGNKFVAVGAYYSGYSAGGSIMAAGLGTTWQYVDQDAGAWLGGVTWCRSKWLVVGDAVASFSDYTLEFSPGRTPSPLTFLQKFKVDFFGGENLDSYNPLRWSGADGLTWAPYATPFAIAFDPPSAATEPPTPETAIEQVCREWWIFAGEHSGDIDASNDPIEVAFPRIVPGAMEDIATVLAFSYAPFGGQYLKTAYTQNVDRAYVAGNDADYFGGWDETGNTNGLAIWNACRAAYLATGSLRRLARSFDSIHTEKSMGILFLKEDADLGRRIDWICRQPRYLELKIDGNESKSGYGIASHRAFCGCRYKPNQTIITARGLSLPERGIATSAEHDYITGIHRLQIAFAPEVPE